MEANGFAETALREQSRRVDAIRIGSQFRKDIELLRCDFRFTASHSEAQRLCSPFSGDAVIAHCSLGVRSGRLRGAVFHNARSLRYTQRVFAKHLKSGAEISRRAVARASPLGDCACPVSRTDSGSSVCGRRRRPPRCSRPFRSHAPILKAGRPAAGCADHHELELIAETGRGRKAISFPQTTNFNVRALTPDKTASATAIFH